MSAQLKVVFFRLDPKSSVFSYFPSSEEIEKINEDFSTDLDDFSVLVIEPKDAPEESKGYEHEKTHLYNWLNENDPDDMEEFVIFVALSEKYANVYDIMEELETQKYENRRYISANPEDPVDLEIYVKEWVADKKNKNYRLYSGEKVDEKVSLENYNAISERMIILCDYISKFIRFDFTKIYDIEKMRKLPNAETGYIDRPFLSEDVIFDMVSNSYFFQVEDPIFKGFLLAHPIQVEGDDMIIEDISDIQNLIFTHGQLRREILLSFIKVVSNFAAKNGFLGKEDLEEEKPEEEKAVKKVAVKNERKVVKSRTGVSVSRMKPLKKVVKEKEPEKPKMNQKYYTQELWKMISERIEEGIE
jgi:hypothetical protein